MTNFSLKPPPSKEYVSAWIAQASVVLNVELATITNAINNSPLTPFKFILSLYEKPLTKESFYVAINHPLVVTTWCDLNFFMLNKQLPKETIHELLIAKFHTSDVVALSKFISQHTPYVTGNLTKYDIKLQ